MTEQEKTALEEKLKAEMAEEDAAPVDDAQSEVTEAEEELPDAEVEAPLEEQDEAVALAEALVKCKAELEAAQDQQLRLHAEFDNFRKRTARQIEQIRKTAAESLLLDLLPVVDNLERALDHADDENGGFAEGVKMVMEQFGGILTAKGLEPIPALGETFDPNVHEALSQMPSTEYDEGVVMNEFQRGYKLGDYILRASQVVVSSGAPEANVAE